MIEFYLHSHLPEKPKVTEINRQKAEEMFPRSNFSAQFVADRNDSDTSKMLEMSGKNNNH